MYPSELKWTHSGAGFSLYDTRLQTDLTLVGQKMSNCHPSFASNYITLVYTLRDYSLFPHSQR